MFSGTLQVHLGVQQSVSDSLVTGSHPRRKSAVAKFLLVIGVALAVATGSGNTLAQGKKKKTSQKPEQSQADRMAKAKKDVVAATNDYKDSLEKLLALQENEVTAAAEIVEKRKELLAQAIISKKELEEESERILVTARDKVDTTKKQIGETDNLIAEATAERQMVKLGPGTYQATAALIRYSGTAHWVLADVVKVQGFFALRFKQALPISAYGQTPVHDQLGFDHRNSIDVAVSPDSAEGKTLMEYLRSAGLPFIAFRHAVRGAATGAHIHIGYPSKRIGK